LADPKSCLNKAREDEWLFVLLGRDESAVVAVRVWIEDRILRGKNRPDDPKIQEAESWIKSVLRERAMAAN
jgi:hypothetical protein